MFNSAKVMLTDKFKALSVGGANVQKAKNTLQNDQLRFAVKNVEKKTGTSSML